MSVKVMGAVFDIQGLSPTLKFVLLAYADHASHDGTGVWPAVQSIAKKTGYSKRTIQNATKELQELGYMKKVGHHESGTNLWKIHTPWVGGAGDSPPGVQDVHSPPAGDSPKPSFNHKVNRQEEEEGPTNIFLLYQNAIGTPTQPVCEELKTLEKDYALYWIEEAFEISKKNNAKSLNYVKAVLQRMKDEGFKKGKAKGTGGYAGPDMSAFDKIRQQEMEVSDD